MKDMSEMLREAQELIDENGGPISFETMQHALEEATDENGITAMAVFGAAVQLTAAMAALMPNRTLHCHNSEANVWVTISIHDEPPEAEGRLLDLTGREAGFVHDGVLVNADGVTPAPGSPCRICGEIGCTDGTCAQRAKTLASIRNMGRVGPLEGLRDVDAKEDQDE